MILVVQFGYVYNENDYGFVIVKKKVILGTLMLKLRSKISSVQSKMLPWWTYLEKSLWIHNADVDEYIKSKSMATYVDV